jgi:DNA-directed RNA polymerase subunit RPC12/RpoP
VVIDLNEYRCRRCNHVEYRRNDGGIHCPECGAFFIIIGKGGTRYAARGYFERKYDKSVMAIGTNNHPTPELAYEAIVRALRKR